MSPDICRCPICALPMCAVHVRCCPSFDDVFMVRIMLPSWCTHATFDASKPWSMSPAVLHTWYLMHASLCRCLVTLEHVVCQKRTCYIRCRRPWTMLLSWCAHTTFDVRETWTMSPNLCNYCFPYAQMLCCCLHAMINVLCRWSMRENHDWCRSIDSHTPCLMRTGLLGCRQMFVDIIFHMGMFDACGQWPMSSVVCRYASLMLIGYVLCVVHMELYIPLRRFKLRWVGIVLQWIKMNTYNPNK